MSGEAIITITALGGGDIRFSVISGGVEIMSTEVEREDSEKVGEGIMATVVSNLLAGSHGRMRR